MQHDCSFLDTLELDGEVSRGSSDKKNHASDFGTHESRGVEPDAVVFVESTDDVSAILTAANERGVPVTPYAAGTGLESNATPVEGGISMDMTRMDAIVDVSPENLRVEVEAGVIGDEINEAVAKHGLFFPPLPSSGAISTIGGMIATDASGQQTVKYGEIADWVLELEVVRADGTVITTGSKAVKTSSGYNLTELFIGSEGTLAVVTKATLELAGRPEQIKGGRAVFPTLDDATEAISDTITSGVDVAKIELIDERTAIMSNAYADVELPEQPMVFLEFHANHGIDEEIDFCRTIFEAHNVEQFEMASGDEMERLWKTRDDLAYAAEEYNPSSGMGPTGDVTVPIGEYPELISRIVDIGEKYDLFIPCFGHAGDGNLHYGVIADYSEPDEAKRAKTAYGEIVDIAIELGGTATGEHGIGVGKREYMLKEHGADVVETMRMIKDALDPNGVLNPGKIFLSDDAATDGEIETDESDIVTPEQD